MATREENRMAKRYNEATKGRELEDPPVGVLADVDSRFTDLPAWRADEFVGVLPYVKRMHSMSRLFDSTVRRRFIELAYYTDSEPGRYLRSYFSSYGGGYDSLFDTKDFYPLMNSWARSYIETCSAGMRSALTNPGRIWFRYDLENKKIGEAHGPRAFLDYTADVTRSSMAGSNMYTALTDLNESALVFGVGVMVVDPNIRTRINCISLRPGDYLISEGQCGNVDACYTRTTMTAEQIKQRFGEKNKGYTERLVSCLSNPALLDTEFEVYRCMQLINTFGNIPEGWVEKGWTWETVYFLDEGASCYEKAKRQGVLAWERHRTCPFICVRWKRASNHPYGISPGQNILPELRQLQFYGEKQGEAVDIASSYPLLEVSPEADVAMDKDPVLCRVRRVVMARQPNEGYAAKPLVQGVQIDFNLFLAITTALQERIKSAFFYDAWLSFSKVGRAMNDMQTDLQHQEQLRQLVPTIDRFNAELYRPLLERVYTILRFDIRNPDGSPMIPDAPEELVGMDIVPSFSNDFTATLQRLKTSANEEYVGRMFALAGQFAQLGQQDKMQEIMLTLNAGGIARSLADNYDVETDITADEHVVAQGMRRFAQAQQAQAQAAQAQQQMNAAQQMSETQISPDNALGAAVANQQTA